MRELLGDYLAQLATAEECDIAFSVLRSLTVCDPTVGSGAFLFAALEVLDPLYAALLGRAAELHERHGDEQCAEFLRDARKHPSERYWMLKTLCLNNLYGVDLMDEAPEIAKLRLFLKLAAQVDDVQLLEPLPDLDFNIKTGNLLVGIADKRDAEERLGAGQLDLGDQITKISELAEHVADAYDTFTALQASDTGQRDHATAKKALTSKLEAARSQADKLLHNKREESEPLESWCASHRPFHWFVEFPSVWRNGGFDVVIGNPPYIKTSLVTDYKWIGYQTQKCPDLYAVCMERATTLINKSGRFAMIVMHSLCFSRHFADLRDYLANQFTGLWISSYARRPDSLFAGSAAVRNSIVCGSMATSNGIHTSRCRRWTPAIRDSMFTGVSFCTPARELTSAVGHAWPFVEDQTLANAIAKAVTTNTTISNKCVQHSEFALWYKSTALYQLGISTREPPTVDPLTGAPVTNSDSSRWMYFRSTEERDFALIALAGRWGYLWWLTYSDSFNVTRNTLTAFPGDIERLAQRVPGDMELVILLELSRTLQNEMPKHLAWQTNAGVKVGRYNMLKLRHLTDKADWLLAKAWGIEDAFEAAGNLRDRMVFGNKD